LKLSLAGLKAAVLESVSDLVTLSETGTSFQHDSKTISFSIEYLQCRDYHKL